jgi:cell division protein ZapA (FtsZ GTPase activity inhibitor)
MKTLTEVRIYGETFTITSEDSEEEVLELATYVDERIRNFAAVGRVSPLRAAIMAAMSLASEMREQAEAAAVSPQKGGYH